MNRRKFLKGLAASWVAATVPALIPGKDNRTLITGAESLAGWSDLGAGAPSTGVDLYYEGTVAYSTVIDAKGASLAEVYDYVKYLTRRDSPPVVVRR